MNKEQILQLAERKVIYDKIWELAAKHIKQEVLCDFLTDQIMDVIGPSLDRLDAYDSEISKEMPSDFKDWWEGSKNEWPELTRMCLEGRREREEWCHEVIYEKDARIDELEREIIWDRMMGK